MKVKHEIKKSKYRLFLAGTWSACFLVLGAGYFILHLPKKEAMVQMQRQYDETRDQAAVAQKAIQEDLRQKMNQRFEGAGQTIRSFSVPQDNTTGLIFEIGRIANELRLSEFASKNQPAQNISTLGKSLNVAEVWLEVEFQSPFLQLAQFINRLEQETPVVFVEKMTIRRDDSGRNSHAVRMQLSFLTTNDNANSVAMTTP